MTTPPTAITGPISPPVAAVSAPPSTRNLAAHALIHVPCAVLQAAAAGNMAVPAVIAPKVRPAAL